MINDTNDGLVNFYEVVKRDFTALQQEVKISLYSRKQHHNAEVIYNNPDMFDRVKRARAVWMLANTSYGSMLDGSFGYDRKGKFLLSSYRNKALDAAIAKHGWDSVEIRMCLSMSCRSGRGRRLKC